MSTKKYLFYVVALALLALASCKRQVSFPVVDTPAIMMGSVGTNDYLVFVEHSDSVTMQGHVMPVDTTMTDTVAFCVTAGKRNAKLHYQGEEITLRPRNLTVDDHHLEGSSREGFFKSLHFQFTKLEIPEFQYFEEGRYQQKLFSVKKTSDIRYAQVQGYWAEMDDETAGIDKVFNMRKAFNETDLDLKLDLYQPADDTLQRRPLVMMAHGGAFYFGSKDDKAVTRWCRYLASMGYVTASIDYRLGFLPDKADISRAGYGAIQDAHAAMRYLVAHQEQYGIDTSMLFVGGCSAGAITMLNLAYMTDATRPEYSREYRKHEDMGKIDGSGNKIKAQFKIKGIVDMWGAIPDTAMMRGHHEPLIAFHGDADNIVPYGNDYPFKVAGVVKSMLVDKMYGSSDIVDHAVKMGNQAQLVTFKGYKHSPHVDPKTKELNNNFYLIQEKMVNFFHDIVDPEKPEIVNEGQWYAVEPQPLKASWQAEGGVIVETDADKARVLWIGNAPRHFITVSAAFPRGIGFNAQNELFLDK